MTQPDPHDELARRLFEAARQERPSAEVRRGAQRGAERGAGAVVLELDQPRPHRAPAVRYAPAIAAAIALVAAASWLGLHGRPERHDAFPITPERSTDEPRAKANQARSDDPASAAEQPSPEPAARPLPRPAAAGNTAAQPRPARPASLAEEVAQLDRARSALAAANGRRALELIDEYERVLRGTRLGDEAELLRIEALALTGQRARAAERARRFVAEHPGSPLADRARALGEVETEVEIEGGR